VFFVNPQEVKGPGEAGLQAIETIFETHQLQLSMTEIELVAERPWSIVRSGDNLLAGLLPQHELIAKSNLAFPIVTPAITPVATMPQTVADTGVIQSQSGQSEPGGGGASPVKLKRIVLPAPAIAKTFVGPKYPLGGLGNMA
jgi:hypothetical protein